MEFSICVLQRACLVSLCRCWMKIYPYLLRDTIFYFHCFSDYPHEDLSLCCHCICITACNLMSFACIAWRGGFFCWFHLFQVMAVKDLCSFSIWYEVQKALRLHLWRTELPSTIPVPSLQLIMTYIMRWKNNMAWIAGLFFFFFLFILNK